MISLIFFNLRHVVTAGHCICSSANDPISHKDAFCKPSRDAFLLRNNQITKNINEIGVAGGHKDRIFLHGPLNEKNRFMIEKAFILDDPINDDWIGTTDIGILIATRPLFDMEKLERSTGILDKPSIVPICLAAKDYNFDNHDVLGVGWGMTYDETPTGNLIRDPLYSSCMTNEVGKEKWRFKACDMKHLQNTETAKHKNLIWSCEKDKLPPDITQEYLIRCTRYFIGKRDRCIFEIYEI